MLFHHLPAEAAHGVTCVNCGDDFVLDGGEPVDVGTSATTERTVRAHAGHCAAAAREVAQAGEQLELAP